MLSVKDMLRCRWSVAQKYSDGKAHVEKNAQINMLKSKLKLRSKWSAKKKSQIISSAIEKSQMRWSDFSRSTGARVTTSVAIKGGGGLGDEKIQFSSYLWLFRLITKICVIKQGRGL